MEVCMEQAWLLCSVLFAHPWRQFFSRWGPIIIFAHCLLTKINDQINKHMIVNQNASQKICTIQYNYIQLLSLFYLLSRILTKKKWVWPGIATITTHGNVRKRQITITATWHKKTIQVKQLALYLPQQDDCKTRKRANIKNQYNQAPHLTQDTNGKVTTSQ